MGPQCQIDRKNLFAIVTMCTYNLSSRNKFPNKMTFRQVDENGVHTENTVRKVIMKI